MLKDLIEQNSATEAVIDECFCLAAAEIEKITCYNITPISRNASDVRYFCIDGFFCEEIIDIPENRKRFWGNDPKAFKEHLIDQAIQRFAFENQHFLNCQYDDIVERCYSYLKIK